MISELQKASIDLVISLNPTEVTITRTEFVEDNGARKQVVTTIRPQTWLIYPESITSNGARRMRKDAGVGDEFQWGALAPSTANVKWGANVNDVFTINCLGTFEVTVGREIFIGSDLNGYELVLKQVK